MRRKVIECTMPSRKKLVKQLIAAAVAYADLAEAHWKHEAWAARTMLEASALARKGEAKKARDLQAQVTRQLVVFDFGEVHAQLIAAVKPFRKRKGD